MKKEKEFYTKKTSKLITNTSQELEFQRKQLESKIKELTIENEILKQAKNVNNEETKDLSHEVIFYRKKVAELEIKHEKNLKSLKELGQQLHEREGDLSNSPKKESEPDDMDEEKTYEKLCKIEKNLKTAIKTNYFKFKQKQKEYEAIEQKLSSEKITLQMKILKTAQQERLLELSISQNLNSKEHNYTDANFLYKPSIKALYN